MPRPPSPRHRAPRISVASPWQSPLLSLSNLRQERYAVGVPADIERGELGRDIAGEAAAPDLLPARQLQAQRHQLAEIDPFHQCSGNPIGFGADALRPNE